MQFHGLFCSSIKMYRGDVVSYKHLYFSTASTNFMLSSSLSGRGILVVVHENKHKRQLTTKKTTFSYKVVCPSHQAVLSHVLAQICLVSWKLINICHTSKSFLIIVYFVIKIKKAIVHRLIISLEVKVPLKFGITVWGGKSHNKKKKRASPIPEWHASRTWHMRRATPLRCERFHMFPDVHFHVARHVACHLPRATCDVRSASLVWKRP